jgi:hypothetical protein
VLGAVVLSSALRSLSAKAAARFPDARKRHFGAELCMRLAVLRFALVLVSVGFCSAQRLAPSEALDRYLDMSRDRRSGCPDLVLAVHIDACLPKLRRQGSMTGIKLISRTGHIAYRSLRFTGDNVVKTNVIARFLANDMDPSDRATETGVTRENYSFIYDKTSDYNGLLAYVFRLRPKRKRVGLFKGELWLNTATATPLRLWGDLIKSPSFFIRGFRFVQDYQQLNQCVQPLRLLLTVQTRIAGEAEMAVWLRWLDGGEARAETDACGSDRAASPGIER